MQDQCVLFAMEENGQYMYCLMERRTLEHTAMIDGRSAYLSLEPTLHIDAELKYHGSLEGIERVSFT